MDKESASSAITSINQLYALPGTRGNLFDQDRKVLPYDIKFLLVWTDIRRNDPIATVDRSRKRASTRNRKGQDMRRIGSILIVLFTMLGVMTVATPAAQAVGSCTSFPSGTDVGWSKMVYLPNHQAIGQLVMYHNPANNGTDSACFFRLGPAKGVSTHTYVQIRLCRESSGPGLLCTTKGTIDKDGPSNYSQYAGRVNVSPSEDVCSSAYGYVVWQGVMYDVASNRQLCPETTRVP